MSCINNWRNKSGKPLSSLEWLSAHHKAKIDERIIFAKQVISKIIIRG